MDQSPKCKSKNYETQIRHQKHKQQKVNWTSSKLKTFVHQWAPSKKGRQPTM